MSSTHSATLRQRVLRAGGWTFTGYGFGQVLRLGSNLVMTRLLAPEMFGVMAIATMITVILSLLSDIGLRQNIVQSQRGDDLAFLDTAWVIQIARGVCMWLVALGVSIMLHVASLGNMLPAASVYASPDLPLVIAVSSFSAVISGFQSTKWATAYRRFDQKRIIQIELIAQLAAIVVMIVVGAASRSIWALVAGGLVASLVTTTLSHTWITGHPNTFRWERSALGELIRFGKWIFVSSMVGVVAASSDSLLLGAFVEADILGLYAIATLVLGAVPSGLTRLFARVSLPAFSEIARNDPARLREVYYKMRVPGDLLLLFLMGFFYSSGQLLIDLLYDQRYSAAGGMLQILALSLFVARYGVASQIYLALGLPRYLAILNMVGLVSIYAVVPPLYYYGGLQAAIWGISLNSLTALPFILYFNAGLGLNNLQRELVVLGALPAGWLCGTALNLLLA